MSTSTCGDTYTSDARIALEVAKSSFALGQKWFFFNKENCAFLAFLGPDQCRDRIYFVIDCGWVCP